MRRNVLIVTQSFAPEFSPQAARATKLAKFLSRTGYEVTVLTMAQPPAADPILEKDLSDCGRVLRAHRVVAFLPVRRIFRRYTLNKPKQKQAAREAGASSLKSDQKQSAFLRFLKEYKSALAIKRREQDFYRAATYYVQRSGLDLSHFDVMISVFSPMSSHRVALYLKEKCPTLRWIADYREIPAATLPKPVKRYYQRYHARVLSHCELLTAASEGCLKLLLRDRRDVRAECIYNGFDPEDAADLLPAANGEEKKVFRILSFGPVLEEGRDITSALYAVEELLKEGRLRRDQIRIDCYGLGATQDLLEEKLAEMDLPPICTFHAPLSQREGMRQMLDAQLLLCPAQEGGGMHGHLPERFFEFLLMRKPILGLVSVGKQSELSQILRSLRVGYCYEEGVGKDSFEGMKKYIAESYTYWRTRSKELYEPDEKKLQGFSYRQIIREWMEVLSDS